MAWLVRLCVAGALIAWAAAAGHYNPTWAVHVEGGRQLADRVAADHGFVNLGEILTDFYHFHHNGVRRRSLSESPPHNEKLRGDARVRWARQQKVLSRTKRDLITLARPVDFPINDHRWQHMWYLNRGGGLDMNVVPAWMEGVTGKGVVVTILDDGLEKDHPDLLANYDPLASYDVNNHDEDPMPRYDMIDSNRHGTRCAGEVAAMANNTVCAVGVAYGAGVGGVRMLDGEVTDAVEARSLSLNPQHIDIYSASWGPDDDGKTVDGPGELATRAFIEGVTKGRSGKGSIYVWASGNGGRDHDNCNCDGYTNSIWTLSISSASEKGEVPWYSEMCSSTLATTYSSGSTNEKQVVTTDLHHACTSTHTGTSASAPLAAGICALALEANRDLTWRDMQHIVVRTAKPANLQMSGWRTNGVGRNVSHSFGYGLMDAAAMVRLARTWRTVPAQHRCEVSAPHSDKLIPAKSQVVLQLAVNHCAGVNYLEHVQAKISLTAARRGDLQINLTSPAGTRVTLLATRSHDISRAGFNSWPFMSVHTWGESPYGIWQLEIHNEGKYMGRATLQDWSLIFYGTASPADKNDPSPYNNNHYKINISQSVLVPSITITSNKNRKNQGKNQNTGNIINPPYVANTNTAPRKNKNLKNQHKNSKNKAAKPTVTTLRGITNKTSSFSRQKGKGPQRQTDSRMLATNATTGQTQPPVTEKTKDFTVLPNVTKGHKQDKTTKAFKLNNENLHQYTAKIQKNVSRQPILDNSQSSNAEHPSFRVEPAGKKSEIKVTENLPLTTEPYEPTDGSTNPPNFRGYIFIDQPPDGHVGIQNSKMPALFERYPKIQHIYPALFPYPKVEVVGNKPSRQHPPMSQFHPELFLGGLAAHESLDSEMDRDHLGSRLTSDDKGDLTKWDMIFFGTDVPAQPGDDAPRVKPDPLATGGELGNGEGEAGQHNSLDEELAPGKWRDTQKVREEGRLEMQDDIPKQAASSGCLNYVSAQPQHCIECHQAFFLYDGQCFASCPAKTYPSRTFTEKSKPKPQETTKGFGSIEALSTSLKRRSSARKSHKSKRESSMKNLEKIFQAFNEPGRPSMSSRNVMRPEPPQICMDCHYSCSNCLGPYSYQCTSCPDDAQLFNLTNGSGRVKESYCYPAQLIPEIQSASWIYRLYIIFTIIVFAVAGATCYFVISCLMARFGLCKSCKKDGGSVTVGYNRLGSDDFVKGETKVNVVKEIHGAIFNHSDSDSDTNE